MVNKASSLKKKKDLLEPHYHIFKITLMEEFMKLNGNTNTMIKFVKLADLNANIATAFLNKQT